MYVMGIDAGTQSIKAVVYDSQEKKIISVTQKAIDLIARDGGVREQMAESWEEALDLILNKIPEEIKNNISAISISGQQHGFVPLAEDGSVIAPVKLWCDTSTAAECREISELYGGDEKLIEKLGNPILPGYTASKIYALRKHNPELYSRMRWVLLPHDYLNYVLTGSIVMERGDASGTGLMNIYTSEWDEEICSIIDPELVSKLPKIVKTPSIIGKISKVASERFGLSKDTVVAAGGGDNMMSAIGTGSVKDGAFTISLGTSGTLFASSSYPLTDRKKRLAAFASSHSTWLPLLCTMNCTVATEMIRKSLGASFKELDDYAEASPIGAEGLVFLPFLNGERVPDLPKGEGVLGGVGLDNYTKENLSRAVYEGVTYEFLLGIEAFREKGLEPSIITLTGGGANSRFWRQMVSDVTGCPVRVPKEGEAAAFGAALQALWIVSGGDISELVEEHLSFDESKSAYPDMENHKRYLESYAKWSSYVESLTPIFR